MNNSATFPGPFGDNENARNVRSTPTNRPRSNRPAPISRRRFGQVTGTALIALTIRQRASGLTKNSSTREIHLEISRNGSRASVAGPADWFTGTTRIDPLFQPHDSAGFGAASVTFEPGSRTAWHTHPLGQTLIVTTGVGLIQVWGESVQEIQPGDVVWFPPGVKHWHGASPTVAMTHIAIPESLDGKVVDWLEHVTDSQYQS